MSAGAWVFMALSWIFVIGLNIFCFTRILRHNKQ